MKPKTKQERKMRYEIKITGYDDKYVEISQSGKITEIEFLGAMELAKLHRLNEYLQNRLNELKTPKP